MKIIIVTVCLGIFLLAMKNKFYSSPQIAEKTSDSAVASSVYPIMLHALNGKTTLDLSTFKGKKILIVNTASECGYTPQYEGLEKLFESKKDKLVIIGCPCNQFGGQEPGDSANIQQFCNAKYKITFPISEKLEVKGNNQHPLYQWLTQKSKNGVLDADVKWNFNKFLIDENGRLMAYFPSRVKPDDAELLKLVDQ